MPNDAGPEASNPIGIGEIDVASLFQLGPLRFSQKACDQRRGILGGKFRGVGPDRLQVTVKSPEGRSIDSRWTSEAPPSCPTARY